MHYAKSVASVLVLMSVMWLPAFGQNEFVDGFEDGTLAGWTQFTGTASASLIQAHAGSYSMFVMHPNDDDPGVVMRDGFTASEGEFEAWFWVNNCYECEAMVAIQAADSNNYYAVTCVPLDLDGQSTILLARQVDGVQTPLAYLHAPGLLYTQEWFKIRVHRYADGRINVFTTVRGVESHQISAEDTVITEAQPFVVGGWGGVYVDDVRYEGLCCADRVGDPNGLGGDEPTLGDIMMLVNAKYIAMTCEVLPCMTEADVNQSGGANPVCDDITLVDIMTLVSYLYIVGPSLGLPDCL
jgi:hypothetical protein